MDAQSFSAVKQTAQHIRRVGVLMSMVILELWHRGVSHDASKWSDDEWPYFEQVTRNLFGVTYGSDEYRETLKQIKPAIDKHYSQNRHHPEHFKCFVCKNCGAMHDAYPSRCKKCLCVEFEVKPDILQMNVLDLLEMLADWKAATERHEDGDLMNSLVVNVERFGIPEPIRRVLLNTAISLGWVETPETQGIKGT